MTTLYKWRVYCTTDAKYETVWSPTEPTTCPADPITHSINAALTASFETIAPNTVQIQEEFTNTQGIYQFQGFKDVIPAGTPGATTVINRTWPYGITLLNGGFDSSSAQIGDELSALVAPNTVIGALTVAANIGDTVLHVSSTVMTNMLMGYKVALYNGINMDELGLCVAIDTVNSTITVQTPLTHAFGTSPTSYIMISVEVVKSLYIGSSRTYDFAKKKVGGKYISANTAVRLVYINNDGVQKDFIYYMELMY
jgi:hypothetical protein